MIKRLACAQGSNAEQINIELAKTILISKNQTDIAELAALLKHQDQAVANDCIKVLYEIGKAEPGLIADYFDDFLSLLKSKNNRMAWGAMIALAETAPLKPEQADAAFDAVKSAYNAGSVITIDNAVSVFAAIVNAGGAHSKDAYDLIIRHLTTCRPKEVPQHAERASVCMHKENSGKFFEVLKKRMDHLTEGQQKRVKRVMKLLEE